MQEIRSSNPPVVAEICDWNKSWAQHHRSLKLGSKLKYLDIELFFTELKISFTLKVIFDWGSKCYLGASILSASMLNNLIFR